MSFNDVEFDERLGWYLRNPVVETLSGEVVSLEQIDGG